VVVAAVRVVGKAVDGLGTYFEVATRDSRATGQALPTQPLRLSRDAAVPVAGAPAMQEIELLEEEDGATGSAGLGWGWGGGGVRW
jgi:hypothetical protein